MKQLWPAFCVGRIVIDWGTPPAFPRSGQVGSMTPEQMQAWRWEMELDERNRPLTDEELDALFPQEGYKVCNMVTALFK